MKRAYNSASRQRAAEETQGRILDAARKLFSRGGLDGVTIAEIAEHSAVASATIYSLFGSKTGILRALMQRAIFNADYDQIARQLHAEEDPVEQLRLTASVARAIYDGEAKDIGLLRGSSAFSPELKKLENEFEKRRFELQRERIERLAERGALRSGLGVQEARDVMWMLTSRDVYRMLTAGRKWSSDKYEKWLADTLLDSFANPKRGTD